MAEVTLTIGGRSHSVACRDGEESHLRRLGEMLDRHAATALRASGGLSTERTMLFIALMLADELDEARMSPGAGVPEVLLERLADRLEAVAATLEEALPSA